MEPVAVGRCETQLRRHISSKFQIFTSITIKFSEKINYVSDLSFMQSLNMKLSSFSTK